MGMRLWGLVRGWVVSLERGSEVGNKGWGRGEGGKGPGLKGQDEGSQGSKDGVWGPGSGVQGLGTGSGSRLYASWHVTCFSGNSMNSSVLATSTKCCSTYLCAALSRSPQECVSAKPRMPRQLEGSS